MNADTIARREAKIALAVGALGLPLSLIGVVAYLNRLQLAVFFFEAQLRSGVPVAEPDRTKVLLMTIDAVGAIGGGLLMLCFALAFAFIRWPKSEGNMKVAQS